MKLNKSNFKEIIALDQRNSRQDVECELLFTVYRQHPPWITYFHHVFMSCYSFDLCWTLPSMFKIIASITRPYLIHYDALYDSHCQRSSVVYFCLVSSFCLICSRLPELWMRRKWRNGNSVWKDTELWAAASSLRF